MTYNNMYTMHAWVILQITSIFLQAQNMCVSEIWIIHESVSIFNVNERPRVGLLFLDQRWVFHSIIQFCRSFLFFNHSEKEMIFLPFHSKIHSLRGVYDCLLYEMFIAITVFPHGNRISLSIQFWFSKRGLIQAFPFSFHQNFETPNSTFCMPEIQHLYDCLFVFCRKRGIRWLIRCFLMLKHLISTLF